MAKQHYLVLFLVSGLLVASLAGLAAAVSLAHEEGAPAANIGLLPTSPIYFLKEWKRGVQRLFTFNPVKKAELELKILDEKAVEAQEVEEIDPQNVNAIKKALANYQSAHERLMARLRALKETSQNPNVDKLLISLAEKVAKHEELFSKLAAKFSEKSELKEVVGKARENLNKLSEEANKKKAKPEEKDKPESMKQRIEVNVTNGGFAPREVKVKKGGEVAWFNKTSSAVWPASAVHPQHLLYPEFDAKKEIKPGESYTFTFEKVGSWKYHNHLNPSTTGVVNVVD